MEIEECEVDIVTELEFMGNTIALVYPSAGKDTFVLLNGQHTDIHQLAGIIRVIVDEAKEFLQIIGTEKLVKLECSLGKAKLRLICLLGFAGFRITNQQ